MLEALALFLGQASHDDRYNDSRRGFRLISGLRRVRAFSRKILTEMKIVLVDWRRPR